MLATALVPRVGYDKAAEVALMAHREGLTILEAGEKLGVGTREQLAEWLDPRRMTGP